MDEKQVIGLAAWVIPLVVVLVGIYAMITGEISLGGHMYTRYHGTTARLMGAAAVIAAVYIRLGVPGVIAGKCTVSHQDQGDKIRLEPSGDVA
jgi:hypothetical protein